MTISSSNGQHRPEPAIVVENLGKRYRIGMREQKRDTLMQSAVAWVKAPLTNFRQVRNLSHFDGTDTPDTLWALRDVSFTVEPGEVVGIVGRNGAGKSTLLKILSRITPPTDGRIILNGRVSSLLEVGTGFHPELTGRENVYLNGTILGMSKSEVDRKFDEIVAFSEVEKFIDTPVKRYSSGMRVRLAFAVSAHLESEILLVDEVLAVGDAAFQQKCLNKMGGVAQSGRTVLFVSHNMQVMQRLCNRALLIKGGRLVSSGEPAMVIERYLEDFSAAPVDRARVFKDVLRLTDLVVLQNGQRVSEMVDNRLPLEIRVRYDLLKPARHLLLGFDVVTSDGTQVFRTYDMLSTGLDSREAGSYESVYRLPSDVFPAGTHYFDLVAGLHRHGWLTRGDVRLRLNMNGPTRSDVHFPGVVEPIGEWEVIPCGEHLAASNGQYA